MKSKLPNLLTALTAAAFLALNPGVHAVSVTVPNFSFEDGQTGTYFTNQFDPTDNATYLPDWTVASTSHYPYGTQATSQFGNAGSSDGARYGFMEMPFAGTTSSMTSAASLGIIQADTTYTLTVALANGGTPIDEFGNTLNYTLSLLADGSSFASKNVLDSQIPGTTTEVAQGGGQTLNTFTDFSLIFTTGNSDPIIGDDLKIEISGTNGVIGSVYSYMNVDNVRLTADAVPEPPVLTLMASSAGILTLGFLFVARRKTA